MIKTVIFDLDGTLLNTVKSMEKAGSSMLRELHLPEQPEEAYKAFAGDGAKTLVERVLKASGQTDDSIIDEAYQVYMKYFANTCTYQVAPYDGIIELLKQLKQKNLKLAVLSNKPHQQTIDVVDTYFGNAFFDMIQGHGVDFPKKPSPDGALWIAKQFGVKPCECIYVGDTNVDMQTGKSAGMKTMGVLWGFRDRKELEDNQADEIIEHPLQILDFINEA